MVIFSFISQFDPFLWIYFSILLLNCLLANRPHVLQFLLWERIFFLIFQFKYSTSSPSPPPKKNRNTPTEMGGEKSIPKEVRCVCTYLWTMDRCIDRYTYLRGIHKHKHVCMCTCVPTPATLSIRGIEGHPRG